MNESSWKGWRERLDSADVFCDDTHPFSSKGNQKVLCFKASPSERKQHFIHLDLILPYVLFVHYLIFLISFLVKTRKWKTLFWVPRKSAPPIV